MSTHPYGAFQAIVKNLAVIIFALSSGVDISFAKPALKRENSTNSRAEKFNKKKLVLKDQELTVEIADTNEKHQLGLMFRKSLSEKQGMLFIFEEEKPLSFWMKNTFIDLDIGFFDRKKSLINVRSMNAVTSVMESELPSYTSNGPALYALEVPKGWFDRHKVSVGATFILK